MTIHFDRLLKLADFLETVPAERFDYGNWAGEGWNGSGSALDCGTKACALGWATAIPEFSARGLHLRNIGAVTDPDIAVVLDRIEPDECNDPYSVSLNSAMRLFGVDYDEAEELFVPYGGSPNSSATAREVAAHIRRFVEERRK